MTTATTTLTEWLLARIGDEEAVARRTPRKNLLPTSAHGFYLMVDGHAQHLAVDPARVLADCAARRAIVEMHAAYPTPQEMTYGTITACSECGSVDDAPVEWPCPTLRHLAGPYASHPDYDSTWSIA